MDSLNYIQQKVNDDLDLLYNVETFLSSVKPSLVENKKNKRKNKNNEQNFSYKRKNKKTGP